MSEVESSGEVASSGLSKISLHEQKLDSLLEDLKEEEALLKSIRENMITEVSHLRKEIQWLKRQMEKGSISQETIAK
eukprot:CAMPEP_0184503532 /NCGR_PEP_ID=MMETSP0113_2-20130426/51946_1 /TAXON_ID=91329 /ORGANISM="Norrisiella sphaerica, Strain BC52" /LENGTH=76 /DNA_ID=CAMNT_0026893049 /DNA_START=421 /DNA_END=651 /DNA_ORIENTATION=-